MNANARVWIFRFLVLAVGGLLVYSWFQPWWSIDVYEIGKNAVIIHPWGLESHLAAKDYVYIESAEMPTFFAPIMFTYLGLAIVALFLGVFAKSKVFKIWKFNLTLPGFLVGVVGFSYIIVVVTAVIIAAIRTGDFWEVSLIGESFIDLGDPYVSGAEAGLKVGYWLACTSGLLLFLLGLFRNRIIGKKL